MLPAVSDKCDLGREPASKRGVAGVRTHERSRCSAKSLINSSQQSLNRNLTAVDLETWSSFLQCFLFFCSPSLSVGGLCHLVRGTALFSEELQQDFFFFKCRWSPPSSGNSYMCQDSRVDSQSSREHWKQQSQSESWCFCPTPCSRGKLIGLQCFLRNGLISHSQRRSSLEITSPLRKHNLTFRIRHRHPERWVWVYILLSYTWSPTGHDDEQHFHSLRSFDVWLLNVNSGRDF